MKVSRLGQNPYRDPAEVAGKSLPLLVKPKDWIHRRVGQVEFVDDRTQRRHVSGDFTIPKRHAYLSSRDPGVTLLPLALLPKQPLRPFDVRDEQGQCLPLLSKYENDAIARATIIQQAKIAVRGSSSHIDGRANHLLRSVATGERTNAWEALHELANRSQISTLWQSSSDESRNLQILARELAMSFVAYVAVPGAAGNRRVIKLTYEESIIWPKKAALRHRVKDGCGLDPGLLLVFVTDLGTAQSYHFEVAMPPELVIYRWPPQ